MPPDASWVLAGGVAGLTPDPALDFTLIVFLHVPTEVRLKRLRCREQQRFGDRILPGGDMHKAHEEFVAWAAGYDAGEVEGKTLARHRAYLLKQRCPVLQIQGAPSTGEALLTVQRELKLRRPARG